jgi:L-lactate dehydrogenase complex protein LldG
MSQSARENILNRIQQALQKQVPVPFPARTVDRAVFHASTEELAIAFAENFTKLQGRFSFCADEAELALQLQQLIDARHWQHIYCKEQAIVDMLSNKGFSASTTDDLHHCNVSITSCEKLIARTGSMLLSSASASGRTTSVYAPAHICIAYTDQLVDDIGDALMQAVAQHPQLPSLITLATGPSRTADIEKTLVVGVHGPKEVFCFLVER